MQENEHELRHRLALHRRLNIAALVVAALVLGGWIGRGSAGQEILRVRGLIVEDSLGRARVVMGAPLPLDGNEGLAGGEGIALMSPDGRFRVAIGAPTPNPVVEGQVGQRAAGGSAGLVIFDPEGNERGGMGTFGDGRTNLCLDYARGVREAACLVVFPDDQYAGLLVNGHPDHGYERASVVVSADGLARVKVSAIDGYERAMLQTMGTGPAQLLVHDSVSGEFVDVMPPP